MITVDHIREDLRKLQETRQNERSLMTHYLTLRSEWQRNSEHYVEILLARIDELNHQLLHKK